METLELAARLEALGHTTRLTVFRILVRAGPNGVPVGAVQDQTGLAPSTLSHHLHKLISVGLVSQRREGRTLYCCAEYPVMNETLDVLRAECCVDMHGGLCREEDADRLYSRSHA
ncbi:MAG: metalloregulator ArsR/SmtB family transcription factor [Gammaproteobacteria bacterium]|jgi:DNA-binding transcriptional ArsR family regulator|nr:metalloregulator ArsR/SmtB family transcription factor [Gammaproteobacteria bacterium]